MGCCRCVASCCYLSQGQLCVKAQALEELEGGYFRNNGMLDLHRNHHKFYRPLLPNLTLLFNKTQFEEN